MRFNDTAPIIPKAGGAPPWFDRLATDATLEATILKKSVHGRENIIALLKKAIPLYEGGQHFSYLGPVGDNLFFESYRSTVAGEPIECMVAVHYNDHGEADSLVINHRPLGAALLFSKLMWEEVGDEFGELYLTTAEAEALETAVTSSVK